jgi:hypothetical protein
MFPRLGCLSLVPHREAVGESAVEEVAEMKRMLLLAVTASALIVAAPGVATAHHHAKRHARHHARHAHLVKFGKASLSTTPSGPTAKSPTTSAPAGTVASFENGILTITLADKSTVSGKVTDATKLECRSATTGENVGDDDNGGGDDNHFGGDEHGSLTAHASDHQGDSSGDDGDDDDNGTQAACTTAALAPGAAVAEAELLVGGGGAVWEKVELQQ